MVIRPRFTPAQVATKLQNELNKIESAIVTRLQREGEKFVRNARSVNTYKDQTGNLRSSIGYVILKDGNQISGFFPGGSTAGQEQGRRTAADAASRHRKGYVLIVVAGMEYAAHVEKTGRDVLSNSATKAEQDIRNSLQQLAAKISR